MADLNRSIEEQLAALEAESVGAEPQPVPLPGQQPTFATTPGQLLPPSAPPPPENGSSSPTGWRFDPRSGCWRARPVEGRTAPDAS